MLFRSGNSGIVAADAQHKFFRLGVNAHAVSDSHIQVMSATMLKPGDVAVIISNSGRSKDLIDVAEIARRRGATELPCDVAVTRGQEMGWFEHGSTLVLLLPPGFTPCVQTGQRLRMGERLVSQG